MTKDFCHWGANNTPPNDIEIKWDNSENDVSTFKFNSQKYLQQDYAKCQIYMASIIFLKLGPCIFFPTTNKTQSITSKIILGKNKTKNKWNK